MKSIVICGSRRFKPEMIEFGKKLKKLGVVVFEPYLHYLHFIPAILEEEVLGIFRKIQQML